MLVMAGPPGGGKSSAFPVASFQVDYFNADDRAASLSGGSYQGIPPHIRSLVNQEFEQFVREHIREKKSFALETTLRSQITLEQAREAHRNGFVVIMRYVALHNVEMHLERVALRAELGGHAASEATLRAIHRASVNNLPQALRELDQVSVFDNSQFARAPESLLVARDGRLTYVREETPAWLEQALAGTEYELTPALRAEIGQSAGRDDFGYSR